MKIKIFPWISVTIRVMKSRSISKAIVLFGERERERERRWCSRKIDESTVEAARVQRSQRPNIHEVTSIKNLISAIHRSRNDTRNWFQWTLTAGFRIKDIVSPERRRHFLWQRGFHFFVFPWFAVTFNSIATRRFPFPRFLTLHQNFNLFYAALPYVHRNSHQYERLSAMCNNYVSCIYIASKSYIGIPQRW